MQFDHAALFGEDYLEPNVFAMHGLASGRVWCALSLGGRAVLARKAGEPVPNEDALCIAEAGSRLLLAVADGHFGHGASHDLIERLHAALEARARAAPLDAVPRDLAELFAVVAGCAEPAPAAAGSAPPAEHTAHAELRGAEHRLVEAGEQRSETTLVVAVVDRAAAEVWGVSVGDSSAIALGLETGARWLTQPTRTYATPSDPATLDAARLTTFHAPVAPGELVVVFSDGVNECEYGSPATSIGTRHFETLLVRAAGRAERFVEQLAALALAGVDGHPGGQDNVALAAAQV